MKLFVFAALLVLAYAKHEQYIGWKSYFVEPTTNEQVDNLIDLGDKLGLDFLSPANIEREALVLVQPENQEEFLKSLDNLGITYKTHADDIKSALDHDDEVIQDWTETISRNGGKSMPFNNYQRLDVIYNYMDNIAARFPNITTLVTPANSFEGRPIKYMKISTTNFQDRRKRVVFIDGGIHGREWISPPTVVWAIRKLTEDVTEPDLLNNYDWILLPVVNPDGYEFTFTDTRFWLKTRSTNTHPNSNWCPGVDGNRNYDIEWNTVGTSNSACSDTYAGNRAFSEIETTVVRDILHQHLSSSSSIILYISMRSFGSIILYPWAHRNGGSHYGLNQHSVGISIGSRIRTLSLNNFPSYFTGSYALLRRYRVGGTSADYAHHIGVPLSYTFFLPGLSNGNQGYNLDPIYIEQVCRETWGGIEAGLETARQMLPVPRAL